RPDQADVGGAGGARAGPGSPAAGGAGGAGRGARPGRGAAGDPPGAPRGDPALPHGRLPRGTAVQRRTVRAPLVREASHRRIAATGSGSTGRAERISPNRTSAAPVTISAPPRSCPAGGSPPRAS